MDVLSYVDQMLPRARQVLAQVFLLNTISELIKIPAAQVAPKQAKYAK